MKVHGDDKDAMNEHILDKAVQIYMNEHLQDDVNRIALAKPVFQKVSAVELAGQISAKKKAKYKLPTWFASKDIYYPAALSIEQSSSEQTAAYKATLAKGDKLLDLTAGFGVDSFFFSKKVSCVWSCEINGTLSQISTHNAKVLGADNITFLAVDGLAWLESTELTFDTIYIDPARRSSEGKVFRLKDCTPDVTDNLNLFQKKANRTIIKTAPFLDITAGWRELTNVSEIHIVSVKNECKELLWVLDREFSGSPKIVCITLNEELKSFSFNLNETNSKADFHDLTLDGYLYEPDVALLKSGAFNLIGKQFNLEKLHPQTQLYISKSIDKQFLGRIFQIKEVIKINELKKSKTLVGNVISRNFPDKAEHLSKKYKIEPHHDEFIIFTQTMEGYVAIKASIIQHY